MSETARYAGSNHDILRPNPVDIPPMLQKEREQAPIRVAVIAMGGIGPLGNTSEGIITNYYNGVNGISQFTYAPYSDAVAQDGTAREPLIRPGTAGRIKDFDSRTRLTGLLSPKDIRFKTSPFIHFGLAAAHEALSKIVAADGTPLLIPRLNEDGTLNKDRQWTINPELVDPLYISTILGCGFGGGDIAADVMNYLNETQYGIKLPDNPYNSTNGFNMADGMIKSLLDKAPGAINQAFNIQGGAEGVVAACSSSGMAMIEGIRRIMNGEAEVVITGGTEGVLEKPVASALFDNLGALYTGNDPNIISPLHQQRHGFTMGEGAVVHILTNPDWAKKHGIKPLYYITGYGVTSDAADNTAPNGVGEEKAMRLALRRAERSGPISGKGKIIYSGHFTGTMGDEIEALRMMNVFDKRRKNFASVFATKAQAAHELGAAHALSQLLIGAALRDGKIPATLFNGEPLQALHGWPLPHETQNDSEVRYGISTSLGFSGHNVVIISEAA